MKKLLTYFSRFELALWGGSVTLIAIAFFLFDGNSYLTLTASLVGVTSLIFNAKGNPIGQLLMIAFSLLYGVISFTFSYYGEMITYLGMTMPMSALALFSWLKNPYKGNKSEVALDVLGKRARGLLWPMTLAVTLAFYFILAYFATKHLPLSTLSVTTSFLAVYLTYCRSPFFALAYAANDLVLIALWILAGIEDIRYVAVVVCFAAFFLNDTYCFINLRKMQKRQQA